MSTLIGIIADIAMTGGVLLLAFGYLKLFDLGDCSRGEVGGSSLSSAERRGLKKKVRFAEDVAEPSGDNNRLRRRGTARSDVRTSGRASARKPGADEPHLNDSALKKPAVSQGKYQTLARSEIPANRLALYEGKRQDYLQRASMRLR